jgi:hypothetical protein
MAFIWALVWLPIGLALGLYAAGSPPQPTDVIGRPVRVPLFVTAWTLWGALSGGLFALVLGIIERRRSVESLGLGRIAVWGAAGSTTLPLLLTVVDVARTPPGLLGYSWRFPFLVLGASAILGAGCAAAALLLARRAT